MIDRYNPHVCDKQKVYKVIQSLVLRRKLDE